MKRAVCTAGGLVGARRMSEGLCWLVRGIGKETLSAATLGEGYNCSIWLSDAIRDGHVFRSSAWASTMRGRPA